MRFSSTAAAALAVALPFATAHTSGFNVAAYNADGSCKTTAQWTTAFNKLKNDLPESFTTVRVYASSDCDTLANAVPAALSTNTKILVGVWTEDSTHYSDEKAALLTAIEDYGVDWIFAVSVGSEDLYRGDTDAATLASQVNDVRGMIRSMGAEQKVGHVDTYTEWINSTNNAVIEACDFLGMDGYPYYQNKSIDVAEAVFTSDLKQTQAASQGKPVWVTETAWPISGPNYGPAEPSLANARRYWNEVWCKYHTEVNLFWFVYEDWFQATAEVPSFGIFGKNGDAEYDLKKCS